MPSDRTGEAPGDDPAGIGPGRGAGGGTHPGGPGSKGGTGPGRGDDFDAPDRTRPPDDQSGS